MRKIDKQKIALVLSTGGARGIAHIGVIEELEKLNYEIASIAGCSMGALVAAAYSTGKLQELKRHLQELNNLQILRLIDFTISKTGFLKGNRIMKKISEIIPDMEIEKMPIPYTAVATNIQKGQQVVFQHGSLHDAIRASISLPYLFVPFKRDGDYLIDGGISCPLPLEFINRHEGDILVASVAYNSDSVNTNIQFFNPTKSFFINQALTLMIQNSIQNSINYFKPNIVIRAHTNEYNILQFNKANELITQGVIAVQKNSELKGLSVEI